MASVSIYTLLLVVAAGNGERVRRVFAILTAPAPRAEVPPRRRAYAALAALGAMALLFAFDQRLVTLLGHGKG